MKNKLKSNDHCHDNPKVHLYTYDLPESVINTTEEILAIDTEAMGLNSDRDRLCLVQILIGSNVYMVHFPTADYKAPNLKKLLSNEKVQKIFHFARFDMGIIYRYLGIMLANVVCTRILSKIARTYSDKHGLKEVCRELLKKEINKGEQSSNWGGDKLTDSQKSYAANDVILLPRLFEELKKICDKENRFAIADTMFKMLPSIIFIDCNKFDVVSLIEHH